MNNLKEYIVEKLKLSKKSGKEYEYEKFCKALEIEQSKYAAKLFDYYYNHKCDCLEGYFDKEQLVSTCFDLMLMLSVLLIEDNMLPEQILKIGTTAYKGKNNPYDMSWFTDENSKGQTVLEILKQLYIGNNDHWFREYFGDFYSIVKNCGNISDDNAWVLWWKMENPEEDWDDIEEKM